MSSNSLSGATDTTQIQYGVALHIIAGAVGMRTTVLRALHIIAGAVGMRTTVLRALHCRLLPELR